MAVNINISIEAFTKALSELSKQNGDFEFFQKVSGIEGIKSLDL